MDNYYTFPEGFTLGKWEEAIKDLGNEDRMALYNSLSPNDKAAVDKHVRDKQIQEFMQSSTKSSSVASAFQKDLFTRIPDINLISSISEFKNFESIQDIGVDMEIDNHRAPLSELVSRLGAGKIDPKDSSIFLPQLKRFKNYVLTNLKKARTSQARVSNLDSHPLHYYHTLTFKNVPPLSEENINQINLSLFNQLRRHSYEHHTNQIKKAQTAINEAVGKMRDELQEHLKEVEKLFNNDFAALTTAQNIIDRNLAELVTYINELTTRTALASEGPKVTNQLFNQGFSLIFKIFTQNINQKLFTLGFRQKTSPSQKGKETEATEEEPIKGSSKKEPKEGSKQKSSQKVIGVNNISSVNLPVYVTEVLNLGANFQIPSLPTNQEQKELWNQIWGQIEASVKEKGGKHFQKNLQIILESYKTCLLPRANYKYWKNNKYSHILITKIHKCSKFLLDNKLIVVVADKGFGLTVVTKDWFTEQLTKHLSSENYVPCIDSLNQEQIRRDLLTIIAKFGNKQLERNLTNLVGNLDAVLPEMYVIPKLHKIPVSSRPITPSHKWLTYKAAKWLAKQWQKYADRIPSILPNSLTLINKFSIKFIPESYELIALDIDNFYPSINALHAGKTIADFLIEMEFIPPSKIDELRLEYQIYLWICNNSYVSALDKVYKQVSGLPMGSPVAPVVANLYLAALEYKVTKSFSGMSIFRYLDDVLLLVNTSILKTYELNFLPKALFNEINLHAKPSKFEITITEIGWPINFLDLVIDRKFEEVRADGLKYYQITFNSFDKPGNLHLYTNPSTFYPRNYVWNWIQGENVRLIRNNSEFSNYSKALNEFIHFLTRRQYPPTIIQRQIAKTKYEERERLLEPVQRKPRSGRLIKVANTASRPIVTRLVRRAIRLYNSLYPTRKEEVSLLVTRGQSLQTTTTRLRRKVLTQ